MATTVHQRFGSYVVLELIGAGTFGKVYKVQTESSKQTTKQGPPKFYALKKVVLSKEHFQREKELSDREEAILKTVKHRHVVRYVDSMYEDNSVSIVMEYCEGGTLHTYIERLQYKMEEDTFVFFLEQIVQGLKYLHGKNILHRDIKTKNILMTKGNCLKISDFGVSKFVDMTGPSVHSIWMGTPRYMSPEIAKKQEYGQKTDIWSLGCTAYEMAMTTYAFKEDQLQPLMDTIKKGKTPDLNDIPYCSEILDLMSKMFGVKPEDRPTAKKILKILLEHECNPPQVRRENNPPGARTRRTSTDTRTSESDTGFADRSTSSTLKSNESTNPRKKAKQHLEKACFKVNTLLVDKIDVMDAPNIVAELKDAPSVSEAEGIMKERIPERRHSDIKPLIEVLHNIKKSIELLEKLPDSLASSLNSTFPKD